MAQRTIPSPFGPLTLVETGGLLRRLIWGDGDPASSPETSAVLDEAARQLARYFAGGRGGFDLPIDWGEGLGGRVRRAMAAIPLGETRTYGALARAVGAPAQAVGQACGANPLPIVIPCHRVVGTHGFGGFSAPGGVETKAALLRFEGALLI